MKKLILVYLILAFHFSYAGHETKSFLIQFETDQHYLDQTAQNKLMQVCDFLKLHPGSSIQLTGRTDYDGSDSYNIVLSKKRADKVSEFLSQRGFASKNMNKAWLGEKKPLSNNELASGKAENRSVEIIISYSFYKNTEEWIEEKKAEMNQIFQLDSKGENVLITKNKTVLTIPAETFMDSKGNIISDNRKVSLTVAEVNTALEAMVQGVFTLSGDKLLETGGMLKIDATMNNEVLSMAPGKEMNIKIPSESMAEDMFVFEGKKLENGTVDWINTGVSFANSNAKKLVSGKLNEQLLLKMINENQVNKPQQKIHKYTYKTPIFYKKPSEPRKPTKPEKLNAKNIISPIIFVFTTQKMRQRAVDKKLKKDMELYNKRMDYYENRMVRYENLKKKYDAELLIYNEKNANLYTTLRNQKKAIDKEINIWNDYMDNKRINQALNQLYLKSKHKKLYDVDPIKSFRVVANRYIYNDDDAVYLNQLYNLRRTFNLILGLDYEKLTKNFTNRGVLEINLSNLEKWKLTNYFLQSPQNLSLDEYIINHEKEFKSLFGDNFNKQMQISKDALEVVKINKNNNYFSANTVGLGWINCDRFVNETLVKVNSEFIAGANQYTILEDIRSIIPSYHNLSGICTSMMPINKKFKHVTIKIEGSFAYISIGEDISKENLTIKPNLKKIPLDEAEILLSSL